MVPRRGRERLARADAREGACVVRVSEATWREGVARMPRLEIGSLPGLLALHAEAVAGALCLAVSAGRWRAGLTTGALLLSLAAFGTVRRFARVRRNARARRVWARGFSTRICERELAERLADGPARFTLHLRRYEGRFAGEALEPAAWLEDRGAGLACAIEPASFAVERICREAGVPIAESGAARARR